MRSIAVNANNSIYVGPDGNLAIAVDQDAVAQGCSRAMKTQTGELNLNLPRGVPTLTTIWNNYRPAQFIAAGRRMLLSVPNVTAVTSFVLTRTAGKASYVAKVQNTFTDEVLTVAGDLTQ